MMFSSATMAQAPIQDIDPRSHPELADAQKMIIVAFQKTEVAQRANRDQMGGHAEAAKDLLLKASRELKLAEETVDHKIPVR
jgi:hypothetical protein